jgi:hypothetical protein
VIQCKKREQIKTTNVTWLVNFNHYIHHWLFSDEKSHDVVKIYCKHYSADGPYIVLNRPRNELGYLPLFHTNGYCCLLEMGGIKKASWIQSGLHAGLSSEYCSLTGEMCLILVMLRVSHQLLQTTRFKDCKRHPPSYFVWKDAKQSHLMLCQNIIELYRPFESIKHLQFGTLKVN